MDARELVDRLRRSAQAPADSLLREMGLTHWAIRTASQRRIGLPPSRMRALVHVARANEISQAELQRQLRVDGAAVTRQVKRLESAGLVSRRPDPDDNRVTLVAVTPKGMCLMAQWVEHMSRFMATCLAGVAPADIETARAVLARIRENVGAMPRCGGHDWSRGHHPPMPPPPDLFVPHDSRANDRPQAPVPGGVVPPDASGREPST